jgi:hypothetical protein
MRAFWGFLGYLFLTASLGYLLWVTVPSLVADIRYRDGFVPATTAQATQIRCTTWSGFIANNCTAKYKLRGDAEEHSVEDFRFGWAPDGPFRLMQHRDMPALVTTDVALATVWNRTIFAVLFGIFALLMVATMLGSFRRKAPRAP